MILDLLLGFLKGHWLKLLGYSALLGVIAYGGYKAYDYVYQRGVASQQSTIQHLTKERDDAVAARDRYIASYNAFVAQSEQDRAEATRQARKALEDVTESLTQAHHQINSLKEQLHDTLTQYIPPEVDNSYSLPYGFVSLYNHAVETPGEGYPRASVPFGTGVLADAPSGVKVSTFASVFLDNLAECHERGAEIKAWQAWYVKNKAIYDKLAKEPATELPQ